MKRSVGNWQISVVAFAALAILAGVAAQPLRAQTIMVGSCVAGSVQFPTIQQAVNAAAAGGTVAVCPGNYPEQVVINKNLTLKGFRSGPQINSVLVKPASGFVPNTMSLTSSAPIAAQLLVTAPATSVTIAYLVVDGTGNNLDTGCSDPRLIGIYYQNASGLLAYSVVRNQAQGPSNFGCAASSGLGVFVQSSGIASTVNITDCTMYGFQKSGIVATEPGTTVTLFADSMIGVGPINIAQIGVEIGYGAAGTVQNSVVANNMFNGNPSAGLAMGILVFDSGGTKILSNSVTQTQGGIALATDGSLPADNNQVAHNTVADSQLGDGIDVCSNSNKISQNNIFTSGRSGVHLDATCAAGQGNNNLVEYNTVIDACAGVLLGGTGNTINSNTAGDVSFVQLSGDTCTATMPSALTMRASVAHGHSAVPVRP